MPAPVVTQLIVDSSGAKTGVAEFEAAMARAKAAGIDGGNATAQSFEAAQRRWVQSLGATDPVIRAQIRMKDDLAKQEGINTRAVQLGIATTDAAKAQMDAVRQKHEGIIQTIREQTGQLTTNEKAWQGFKNATSGVSGQLIALSAGAGPVGVFLSALGPWGVAAAVGIGAVSSAINHMISEANRMGDGSIAMRRLSETTDLSITQLKALGRSGAEFGVGTDAIGASVEKFTINMEQARKGTGDLYNAVRMIDRGLADELSATTTTAQAWDVLAKARAAASDQSKNALSKAAFNKGGLETGLVLDVTNAAGGLDAIIARQQKINGLDDDAIKKWGITKVQIEEAQKRTANLMAATYTQDVLDRMLQAAQLEERIARSVMESTKTRAGAGKWYDVGDTTIYGNDESFVTDTPADRAKKNLGGGLAADQKPDLSGYEAQRKAIEGVTDAQKKQKDSRQEEINAAIKQVNTGKEELGYLGSAATATERQTLRIKELDAALKQTFVSRETYDRAVASVNLDTQIAQQNNQNAALGASAPIIDLVTAKSLQLQKLQQEGANLTPQQIAFQKQLTAAQALGTYQIKSQIDAEAVKQQTVGMSVGAAAAYTAEQTRLNKAVQDRQVLTPKELKDLHDTSTALGLKAQASAQVSAKSKADFDLQTMFLSDTEKSIAQVQFQLRGDAWQAFMNDGLSASLRLAGSLKDLQGYTTGFTTDLAHGLEQGKSLLDSVSAAAVNLGQKLIDAGLNTLVTAGLGAVTSSLTGGVGGASGAAALTAGGASAAAALTAAGTAAGAALAAGGASAAAALGLPAVELPIGAAAAAAELAGGGAAAGTILVFDSVGAATVLTAGGAAAGQAIWGPIAAITAILVGIGLMSSASGGEEKVKKAKQTWVEAGPAFQKFLTEMSGGVQGDLVSRIQDAASREAAFEKEAWDARDTAAINAARAGLQNFSDSQKRLFQSTFAAMVKGFSDGLGQDSPFLKAVNTTRTALNTALAFIDDANTAIGAGASIDGVKFEQARTASQSYLLSLLQTPAALTPVQTGLSQIQGTANALQGALVQLGMSSTDAAKAINDGVSKAISSLKTQFEAGLTERLNTANGQSFINDATKLIAQHQQDLLDAASLGTDPALVAATFKAEAQQIVNSANLVGDAFTGFKKQFPDLAGVVVEATADVASSAKQLQDSINGTAKTIVEFISGLTAGANSPLSPTARLAASQTAYNATLALAQTGDIGAQGRITTDAQNLLDAARAVYASSTGYQLIFQNVTAQLLSLPAVQQTTDSTVQVMRDVLTAINISNQVLNLLNATAGGTTGAVNAANTAITSGVNAGTTTLNGVILPAVNAGSAVAVASNLAAYFNNLSAVQAGTTGAVNSGTGALTQQILPAVNAGNATNVAGALAAYFNQIDPSGRLASLVLTTTNMVGSTALAAQNTANTNLSVDQVRIRADTNNALTGTNNELTGGGNTILTAIQTLQGTANTQLTLLKDALTPTAVSVNIGTPAGNLGAPSAGGGLPPGVLNNQVVTALNKIVYNTYAIASNTAYKQSDGTLAHGHAGIGVYATGGWVRGGIPGVDSVRILAQQKEFIVNPYATDRLTRDYGAGIMDMINSGRLPQNDNFRAVNVSAPPSFRGVASDNGNAALIAELREVKAELQRLQQVVSGSGNQIAQTIVKKSDEQIGAVDKSGRRIAYATTQAAKEVSAAA
jgi:hypothetical protein